MKQVPLSREQVATVDDCDFEWLSEFKWCALWKTNTQSFYAVRHIPTGPDHPKRQLLSMHNAIWEHHNGPIPDGLTIDHIDRTSLNNRQSNLRIATHSQQKQNQRLRSTNTSGYRGVHWDKSSGRWRSQIKIDGKQIWLGHFTDPADAARAFDVAALQRDPTFAQLNFPIRWAS